MSGRLAQPNVIDEWAVAGYDAWLAGTSVLVRKVGAALLCAVSRQSLGVEGALSLAGPWGRRRRPLCAEGARGPKGP